MSHNKALKAIRRFCLDCQGGSAPAVRDCQDHECPLFSLRLATIEPLPEDTAPLRIIRAHCLDCAGSRRDARNCDAREACPLWSYRFGVLPATFKRVAARRKKARETLLLPGFQ